MLEDLLDLVLEEQSLSSDLVLEDEFFSNLMFVVPVLRLVVLLDVFEEMSGSLKDEQLSMLTSPFSS